MKERHSRYTRKHLLVRFANPASVICRASRLSDLRFVNPESLFRPLSVTEVNDRFKSSSLFKPGQKHEPIQICIKISVMNISNKT